MLRFLASGAVVALAFLVTGCGGGGSSSGGGLPPLQSLDQQTLVVQMDQNGDNELDLVTLDLSESPFVILECLYGMPGGDFEDVSPMMRGMPIDPAVSGALATYMGGSFGEDRTEIDVTNSNGDPTRVVVFGIGGAGPNGVASLAAEILDVRPACAAPGDAVLIKGSGFGESPTVTFDGTEAKILRHDDTRIICRVPDGLAEGEVSIDVDGASASFNVLKEGAPVIVHVSAGTATPGMLVFFIGARLKGASADFKDSNGDTAAVVDLKGGWRVCYLKVPEDLTPDTYTIVISNEHGESGLCSPTLVVVEAGDPAITSIEPSEQLPGRSVLCTGTDLGPPGFCFVTWTDGDDNDLFAFGFANGYDKVHSWVPHEAQAGATYDVTIDFADGSSTATTGAFSYTVGTPDPPEITGLEYDEGPAGSLVGIFGTNLVGSGYAWPVVEFTKDGVATEAAIYFAFGGYPGAGHGPGMGGSGGPMAMENGFPGDWIDHILAEVPPDLEDGEYEVTVTVNGQTSNAVVFTVGDLPLTVTSMSPDGQGPWGPEGLVFIEGTGFGVPDFGGFAADGGKPSGFAGDPGGSPFEPAFTVTVTWEGDGDPLEGNVLWHTDREILVIPPGGWQDPLPVGEYTVYVTVERDDGSTETVEAGLYTVHSKGGGGGFPPTKPPPGHMMGAGMSR